MEWFSCENRAVSRAVEDRAGAPRNNRAVGLEDYPLAVADFAAHPVKNQTRNDEKDVEQIRTRRFFERKGVWCLATAMPIACALRRASKM